MDGHVIIGPLLAWNMVKMAGRNVPSQLMNLTRGKISGLDGPIQTRDRMRVKWMVK